MIRFNTLIVAAVCGLATIAFAQTRPAINWSVRDITGAEVKVPSDPVTVLAFVRAEQEQSQQVLKQIRAAVPNADGPRVVVILSGPMAAAQARVVAATQPAGWPVVADGEFAASGKMDIHVWPTTLIIKSDGEQLAHLAGSPRNFALELQGYLDFAAGKIDKATLDQRLANREVIADTPHEKAVRHVQVAEQLISRGRLPHARTELEEAKKLSPDEPLVQLGMARLTLQEGKPADAIVALDAIKAGAIPGWRINVVRVRALIALEKWGDAASAIPDALKLNPEPAEAHYLAGLIHEHNQFMAKAAEEYRKAYEAIHPTTGPGR